MGKVTEKSTAKPKSKAKTKTKTVAYDVAKQLRTPEEMAAYLDAWLQRLPTMQRALLVLLAISHARAACRRSHGMPG